MVIQNKALPLHSQMRDALLAQLVEQLTLNQWVQGSSPCASTNKYSGHNGRFFVCEKYVFFPRFHAYTTGIHTYINIRLALVQLQC